MTPAIRLRAEIAVRHCREPAGLSLDAPHHSLGSMASSYSFLNRAINSAAGTILPTLPTPWPDPQISFQAFGFALSPEASVPKLIFDGSDSGRWSVSMPAATIDGFRKLPSTPV